MTVRQRKVTPAKSATKRSFPEASSGMKQVRRTVVKSAILPEMTESKLGRTVKPKTLRKGTQTIETVDSGGKKRKTTSRGVRKDEKLSVRGDRKTGPRRLTAARQQESGRKGKRQPKDNLQKNLFESNTLNVSTPTKSSSPGSLLMCREAHRLKATEGLDYIASTGSPRPLLVLTSHREGTEHARAQINNCAVTVHMTERVPFMSPMVTVNIPSSVLLTDALETGCGVGEDDVSLGINIPDQAQAPSTATPSVDVAVKTSVPSNGEGRNEQVDQTDTGTSKDLNNLNNKETLLSEDKVVLESPQTNFMDDISNDVPGGYVAGSDTDHATDNGDSNVICESLPSKQQATNAVNKESTAASVHLMRDVFPAPKSDMISTSASTGRGKRRTRSRRQTAEKVKRWLVNSSSSNIESTPLFEHNLEDKHIAEDSFMSGIALLPSTTPARQKSGSSKNIPNSKATCKRGLEQDLPDITAVKIQPATGEKSCQTPPCRCRSCRRKRRDSRSEAAESSVKKPRIEEELSPDAYNQEFNTAWCLLL